MEESAAPVPSSAVSAPLAPPDLEARLAAVREEEKRREDLRTRVWKERRVLLPLLALVLLALPNFRMARVVGRSMEPQYINGDLLLVWKSWKLFGPLRPGDIIVFRHRDQGRDQELVKRVVFVQNEQGTAEWPETVETSRGSIPIARYRYRFPGVSEGLDRLPSQPGSPQRGIYVLGDNFPVSNDSRDFGPIAVEDIVGKVVWKR